MLGKWRVFAPAAVRDPALAVSDAGHGPAGRWRVADPAGAWHFFALAGSMPQRFRCETPPTDPRGAQARARRSRPWRNHPGRGRALRFLTRF